MPSSMPKPEMSWLSPKRRRTTGNLKTTPNAQATNGTDSTSPVLNDGKARPALHERAPSTPTPNRPTAKSLASSRPLSQPSAEVDSVGQDGNLFYAYARRFDDGDSRYLLTFASAGVANQWWLLLQVHFPECTRPGPQLFSFKDADLLSKAWRHPSFAHLKSKWMYISFGDTKENGLGGAAQGIIPVQDAQGNMLGGSSASVGSEVRKEAKLVRNEMSRLEELFESVMEAMERNTQQVAHLAAERQRTSTDAGSTHGRGDYFDLADLSAHLGRINDLLSKNQSHFEQLSEKQVEHSQKLQATMQDLASRQQIDPLDMSQLSAHLDRLQNVVEQSINRKDSAKELSGAKVATKIDFTPLTDRLEKVQEAVEQNSALIKALLDEGSGPDEAPRTPFWGRELPQTAPVDLSPLTEHLQKIHAAIEQQSQHIQSLVGSASGEDGDAAGSDGGNTAEKSLQPLGEHLEQIYNAIEEGNKHAESMPKLNASLSDIGATSRRTADGLQQLLEKHEGLLEDSSHLASLTEKLGEVNEHLESLREWTEFDSEQLKALVDGQTAIQSALEASRTIDFDPLAEKLSQILKIQNAAGRQQDSLKAGPADIDFTPVTERLARIHASLEKQSESPSRSPGSGDPKFVMSALTSHLSKIQVVTESNAMHIKSLNAGVPKNQDKMQTAVTQTADAIRILSERQAQSEDKFERRLDATNGQVRELMAGQREMVSALRELSMAITAQNKDSCDHVVIPPPRKTGRKVVGFVYDAKEGARG